ncbi:MAG: hypothetical protein NTV88_05255, partial [Candidatus Micrarchaeota archaeon]|nr:hypothetical protein [Candidatus Micrarchaeota archaeon]
EPGICFSCGKETTGTPAKADWLISGARRFRALLSLPKKHTVACSECFPTLLEKRKKFEKNLHWCKIGAVAFALLVIAGAVLTDSIGLQALFGAVIGAIFVLSLAYFAYCPSFQAGK